jgi:uncharacterized membrane protein YfcA
VEALLLLAGAGLLAGAMNALAGGGSFVSLPALIAVGVPSVAANASSTVALYPGGLASAWVYRTGLSNICGVSARVMLAVTLVGGLAGSLLLLLTPSDAFDLVLPWLLLLATLALAFGRRIAPWLQSHVRLGAGPILGIQFGLGIYGGYFGGAVGLMMLAAWSLLGQVDVKALNPPRTLMVSAANTIAVLCFVLAGVVHWRETLVLGAAAIVGGYLGAVIGKRLDPKVTHAATVVLSVAMTVAFFVRAWRG